MGNNKSEDLLTPLAITACAMVATTVALGVLKQHRTKTKQQRARTKNHESWESHVVSHGPLEEVWPGTLYTLEAAGAGRGPPCRNMHIYRVPGAPETKHRLLIFNGIAVDEETMTQIEKLGEPSILVVPNYLHRCCAAVWKQRYPAIIVVCPKCAIDKASEVVPVDFSTQELAAQPEWSQWIHAKEVDGWAEFETVLELELETNGKGKKAVLVCDMLFTMPYRENARAVDKFMTWIFDSCITLPPDGSNTIVVPKVARISRMFALQDWPKAEQWFRSYAQQDGPKIATILVGHGVPVKEINATEGCTKALEGVAEQLVKPRW